MINEDLNALWDESGETVSGGTNWAESEDFRTLMIEGHVTLREAGGVVVVLLPVLFEV